MGATGLKDVSGISIWPDLEVRNRRPELMDDPQLDPHLHQQALRNLSKLNSLACVYRLIWNSVEACCRENQLNSLSVLDLACGSGDLLIWLRTKARSRGIDLQVTGCDVSKVALQAAQDRAEERNMHANFVQLDVLTGNLPGAHDLVVCSLFLHHLEDHEVVDLLHRMADAAGYRLVVQDLLRSRLGYLLCCFGARLLTRSPVVRVDGPLSVAGAFTLAEIRRLAEQAGLSGCQIERRWPERFVLTWKRSLPKN